MRWSVLLALLGWCSVACIERLSYPHGQLNYQALRSTEFTTREGESLYVARSQVGGYGRPVELGEVSPYLVSATLSGEDANFWGHLGVDPIAVGRAIWLNVSRGRVAYGGSTVSQQLAGLLVPRPRTLAGKSQEALDAVALELRLSKTQILEQYLNRVYYGRLAYGAEAGARRYFGKSAKDLELHQAALLAVLPRAPTFYDLDKHPERALARRRHLLSTMAARGWISQASAERAADAAIALIPRGQERTAPHAIDLLTLQRTQAAAAVADYPPNVGAKAEQPAAGSQELTSIDAELQRTAERSLRAHLNTLRRAGATQAAIVVIHNRSRQVRALVGSAGYDQVEQAGANNGALSLRPPGSTLKPFVYALALEDGAVPQDLVLDAGLSFAGYAPRAAHGAHHGWVPLQQALGSSLNAPAVLLAERSGAGRLRDRLVALNLVPRGTNANLSLSLGGTSVRLIDLTNAYATLASDGVSRPWTLRQTPRSDSARRIFSSAAANQVMRMLSQARARRPEFGMETPLDSQELGVGAVAAKTGTSQSFCDNWTIASTAKHTVGVWVGNFDGAPLHGVLAMQGAAPLARSVLQATAALSEPGDSSAPPWTKPSLPTASAEEPGKSWSALAEHPLLEQPTPGARFRLDPLMTRESQALTLTAIPHAKRTASGVHARFIVDGKALPLLHSDQVSPRFSASWPLQAGEHVAQVEILDDRGLVVESSATHHFHVEGT